MPTSHALSGQLPNDPEHNGILNRWEEPLVAAGGDARLFAFVVFDVPKIVDLTEDGTRRPVVRLRHVEPIAFLEDAPADLVTRMTELRTARNGGDPLPTQDDDEVYVTGPEDDPNRGETLKRKATKR